MPGDLCVGIGGLGKITLDGGVYESPEISERFEKCVFAMGSGSKILVFMMQHMRQNKTTREWKKQKQ